LLVIHTFPIETLIRNAAKGGKPDRKPYHPYGFINQKQSMQKTQVCSWRAFIHFIEKLKTKVETSSLRNLKIMPRNLNEIVLS
jgi:hypothetical protein